MDENEKEKFKKRTTWVRNIFLKKETNWNIQQPYSRNAVEREGNVFERYDFFNLLCIYQPFLMRSLFFSCYNYFFSYLKIIIFFCLPSNCIDICFILILSIRHNLISIELDHQLLDQISQNSQEQEKVFLEITQISQESTCARDSGTGVFL